MYRLQDRGSVKTCEGAMKNRYSVWVGGIEVNDYYLDYAKAQKLAEVYKTDGYDDVKIEKVK